MYPGQLFKIPVVLYGQRNGSVPGIVNSTLKLVNTSAHFAPLQETQKTEYSCTNLNNIFSTGQYELIELRADAEESRPTINVTLLPCPPGFQLSSHTAQCATTETQRSTLQHIWFSTTGMKNQVNMGQSCSMILGQF